MKDSREENRSIPSEARRRHLIRALENEFDPADRQGLNEIARLAVDLWDEGRIDAKEAEAVCRLLLRCRSKSRVIAANSNPWIQKRGLNDDRMGERRQEASALDASPRPADASMDTATEVPDLRNKILELGGAVQGQEKRIRGLEEKIARLRSWSDSLRRNRGKEVIEDAVLEVHEEAGSGDRTVSPPLPSRRSKKEAPVEEPGIPHPAENPVGVEERGEAPAPLAQRDETGEYEREKENDISWLAQERTWTEKMLTLRDELGQVLQSYGAILSRCERGLDNLSLDLEQELRSRSEGLLLIDKMLRRAWERIPEDEKGNPASPSMDPRGQAGFARVCREEGGKAQEDLPAEDLEERRQRLARDAREGAERSRKRFLSLIEKQVLPALDGIDDGETHSLPAIERMKSEYPDSINALDAWFHTYRDMRREALRALNRVGIHRMEVVVGAPVDYEKHEPFDVESSPGMEDERIKALVREGYEYRAEGDEGAVVLRPAQVIVVKNQ